MLNTVIVYCHKPRFSGYKPKLIIIMTSFISELVAEKFYCRRSAPMTINNKIKTNCTAETNFFHPTMLAGHPWDVMSKRVSLRTG